MTSTVRVQLDEADYVAAQRLFRRRSLWWPIVGLMIAGALALIAFDSVRKHNKLALYMSVGALIGGLIGGLFTHYFWIPWRARRVFRQQKTLHRTCEISWDSNDLHAKDDNGEYRHLWSDFVRWREGERLIVLNLSDAMFLMVPKRAFTEDETLDAFRELVRSHVAN